jgi:hypothetical protein
MVHKPTTTTERVNIGNYLYLIPALECLYLIKHLAQYNTKYKTFISLNSWINMRLSNNNHLQALVVRYLIDLIIYREIALFWESFTILLIQVVYLQHHGIFMQQPV